MASPPARRLSAAPLPDVPDLDRPLPRGGRTAALLVPPLSIAGLVALAWALEGGRTAAAVAVAFGFYLGIGTSIVFAPAIAGTRAAHLDTWTLGALAAFFSVATTSFWSFNLELAERIPRVGPRVARIHDAAAATLRDHPWIRRWTTLGVFLFVVSPLPGSGTIGGSVVGRLVGLSRLACFLTVSIASLVVVAAYASFGDAVEAVLRAGRIPVSARIAIAIAAVSVILVAVRWLARSGAKAGAPPPPDGGGD